jgi:hypothetical protein
VVPAKGSDLKLEQMKFEEEPKAPSEIIFMFPAATGSNVAYKS